MKNPTISLNHFEDIIVTALEGGSNYWYELDVDEFRKDLELEDGEPLSTRIAKSLFENPNFKMNVYDIEEPGEILGTVTQKSMLTAIETAYYDYNHIYNDMMEGTGDADTTDMLFQLATMGEITFG